MFDYMDEVMNLESSCIISHLKQQQRIYDVLRDRWMVFKISKSSLNYPATWILGHICSKEGRTPDPKLVESITRLSSPTDKPGLRSLLGLAQVVREYIPGLTILLEPIQRLVSRNVHDVNKHLEP